MEAGTGYSGECKSIAWVCRDGVRKAKATLGLNLARDTKGNKKVLCKNSSTKKQAKEDTGPLYDKEYGKAEVHFYLGFHWKVCPVAL